MKAAATRSDSRAPKNFATTTTPHDSAENGTSGSGSKLTFTHWLSNNNQIIRDAQTDDGLAWLSAVMVDAPDSDVLRECTTDGYDKKNWRDKFGKRGSKEGFNAYWTTTKTGCPLLKLSVHDFSGGTQAWHGSETITRLWEEAPGEHRDKRTQRRQAKDSDYEQKIAEYNAMCDAENRERKEAEDAKTSAETARRLAAALAEYQQLPETKPGKYFCEKGFADAHIPGLKRGHHDKRGGYDILPIQDTETGAITSLAYFWDAPFENKDGEMVRKTFAAGGRVGGCAVFLNGFPRKNFTGELVIGEGVATVLTMRNEQQAENICYVAALSLQNIERTYRGLKRRCRKAAAFRLILDNDWRKALEINADTGAPKRNMGLEVGSDLAMRHNLWFYMPDFLAYADAEGNLSDFNDLLRVAGAAEVKRQLTLRYADPDVVFHGERERETARLQGVFAQHDVTVIHERYVSAELIREDRTNLVVSAPGTGKSRTLKDLYARNPEKSRLVVTPLAALAVNKAEDLGDACYQAFNSDTGLRSARRLVICQDSLPRLVPPTPNGDEMELDEMPAFEIVTLEEPATLFDRQTSDISHKVLVRDTMRSLVQAANTVVAIDADFDAAELAQLERWRPGERFNVVINTYAAAVEVHIHDSQNDLQTAALEALEAGENLAYPCTTAAAAREADKLFRERVDVPGLVITADNDGDAKVKAFTKRPNDEVHHYRYVTYSPKWETGLSVDRGHGYKRLFGEVDASIDAPRRVMQRVARFREIGRWDLYIDPNIRTHPTDENEIRARWGTSLSTWDSELLGLTAERRRGIADADYERLVVEKTVAENIAKTNLRFNLLRRLYARGATLHFLRPRSEMRENTSDNAQATDLIAERRALEKADECERLIGATPITDAQATVYSRIRTTGKQSTELTAYRIRRAHGLDLEGPLEEHHVSEYRGGALEVELRRLERAGTDSNTLRTQYERRHDVADRYRADDRYYGVESYVYGAVLRAYNVDPQTYILTDDATVTKDTPAVHDTIEMFIARRDDIVAAGFKLQTPDKMREDPLRVFGNVFRRLNLTTKSGKNKAKRDRSVNVERLAYMRDLILSRRTRENEQEFRGNAGTVKHVNTNTLVDCPHFTVPEPDFEVRTFTTASTSPPVSSTAKPVQSLPKNTVKQDSEPKNAAAYLRDLLERGQLEVLGEQRVRAVRRKLNENDQVWLHTLATSRGLQIVLNETEHPQAA